MSAHIKAIISDLLVDVMGGSGIALMLSVPSLEYVNDFFKIAGGALGLVLLVYSIQLKRILIKKENNGKANPK